MIQLIGGQPGSTLCRWAQAGFDVDLGDFASIGVVRDGELIGAFVYNNYAPEHSIEMGLTTIDPRWCTRRVLRAAFDYPFHMLRVKRIQATTHRRNRKARDLVQRLGFKFEGIGRKAWPTGGDAAVYSLLRHECRWIDDAPGDFSDVWMMDHGQKDQDTRAA